MSNQFKWTDELVQQYCATVILSTGTNAADTLLTNFKTHHTPAPEPKDWEIESYKNKNTLEVFTKYSVLNNSYYSEGFDDFTGGFKCQDVFEINSVKRLSDGEVFSIGDEITFSNEANKIKITCLNYFNGCMLVGFGNDSTITPAFLDNAKKLAPKPLPLFTRTEDGVEVFEGDDVWHICVLSHGAGNYEPHKTKARIELLPVPSYFKYFSTESAAANYCLMNKPCLSVNDIITMDLNLNTKERVEVYKDKVIEVAQSKQSIK